MTELNKACNTALERTGTNYTHVESVRAAWAIAYGLTWIARAIIEAARIIKGAN